MRLLRDSEGCAVGPKFSRGLNEIKRDLFLALAIFPERMVFTPGRPPVALVTQLLLFEYLIMGH